MAERIIRRAEIQKKVWVLGLDNLYNRVVFGYPQEAETEYRTLDFKAEIELSEKDQKGEITKESEVMKDQGNPHLGKEFIKRKNCNDSTYRKPKQEARIFNKFRQISPKIREVKKLRLPNSGSRRRLATFIGSTIPSSQHEESPIPPLIKNILAGVAIVMLIFLVYLFY